MLNYSDYAGLLRSNSPFFKMVKLLKSDSLIYVAIIIALSSLRR